MNDILTYWANGLLVTGYALWHVKYAVVGLTLALFILARYGAEAAATAGNRPLRYGRGTVNTVSRSYWLSRLFAIGLWTLGALLAPTDIEGLWSIVLWGVLLVALLAIPAERAALVFRHLWGMAIYGLGMIGLRLLLGTDLNLDQLTRLLRVSGDSATLLSVVRTSLLPYAGFLLWFMYPVGTLAMLFQRFQIVRGSLGARGRPQDIIHSLTTRGEGPHSRPRPPISGE